ncbi:MAG: chemotaxis protein CheC [Desulfobacterales bacterium]|nr:chemotaxis protein CheC [Desulfobacterales bacterium]MBF0396722.1 chemotaxis protein CheC [Desulfobacterales bacterium]
MSDANELFSDEEKDILQEVMNIAFGSATADLAEVIDICVVLSIPQIKVISAGELPDYIRNEMSDSNSEVNIVDQKFWGDFKGSGLLVFPANSSKQIIRLFEQDIEAENMDKEQLDALENNSLTEVGNILIGACVGKISELLKTFVTYSPPEVINSKSEEYKYMISSFDPDQSAIIMRTVFEFEQKNVNGFLLLLTNQDSIAWLRKSLNDFMESF